MRTTIVFALSLIVMLTQCAEKETTVLSSPDGSIVVSFEADAEGKVFYNVTKDNAVVLEKSRLGLMREDEDFTQNLKLEYGASESLRDSYTMLTGKRTNCLYEGNKQVLNVTNANGKKLQVIFQVSNDGVAFRYYFAETDSTVKHIKEEYSTFNFPDSAKAWTQPMAVAKSGWNQTNPSYEENYEKEVPVGTPSPMGAGWIYPALFHVADNWVLLTETALDRQYCGTRLIAREGGEYQVGFPDEREVFTGGNAFPQSTLPWLTPWRVIAIGSLATLVESTLGSDLANPPAPFDTSAIKPGISAWSWVLLKDDSTVFDVQKKFIDYASEMHWQYVLVDADWDKKIGYEKAKELVDYGKTKGIDIILWYNSAGAWNTVPYTPKDKLITHESRTEEYSRLQQMGVKGMKIDFFGGDGQSMINYYIDIMEDAKPYGLHLNFHGATLPRGWQRTYPHLMTMESIKGMEFVTFDQRNADNEPSHACVIPFTRNVFDPMDFTPMALYKIPNIERKTTSAFELATAIVFTSGIQHMAETPQGMKQMPDFVINFLQRLPTAWEDVKFIDGYPGKLVVLARKAGDRWIVAGMNGEPTEKSLTLDLSFIKSAKGNIITDGDDATMVHQEVLPSNATTITLKPHGGFVMDFGK